MIRRAFITVPALLGLVIALAWQAEVWPNAVLYTRLDAGTAILLVGLAVTIIAGIAWAFWSVAHHRYENDLAQLRADHADGHYRFLRRLDHELKNPLMGIRAGLANLDAFPGTALPSVHNQVDRLARLTGELRKLAELDTQPIEQERVDIADLLGELIDAVQERRSLPPGRITASVPRIPWPLPQVLGDRDLIYLALHNVVDNAVKFCRAEDKIEVRAYEDGPSVTIEIADTGPGVPQEELPHLGEELYRASTGRSVEGTGLGLALAKSILRRHAGTMAIRSRMGQGTIVTLRFPAAR